MTEGLRCETCGAPVDRTIEFCTACGAYLGWAEKPDAGPAPAREAEADIDTAPVAVAGGGAGRGRICPSCGASNVGTRTFCSHCGTALDGVGAASTQPVPVVSVERGARRRVPVVAICAVVIMVIAVGIVLVSQAGTTRSRWRHHRPR